MNAHVYLFESRRDAERSKAQARATAAELARILVPLFGGEMKTGGNETPKVSACEHKSFTQDGSELVCKDCGARGN